MLWNHGGHHYLIIHDHLILCLSNFYSHVNFVPLYVHGGRNCKHCAEDLIYYQIIVLIYFVVDFFWKFIFVNWMNSTWMALKTTKNKYMHIKIALLLICFFFHPFNVYYEDSSFRIIYSALSFNKSETLFIFQVF